MKLLYSDIEFTAVSDFTVWVGKQDLKFWEDDDLFGPRAFLTDFGWKDTLKNGEEADYLIDGGVYPQWIEMRKKFASETVYDTILRTVENYEKDYGFDMNPLMNILKKEKSKRKFKEIFENYKNDKKDY